MWIHSSSPQEWSGGQDAPKTNPLELSTFAVLTFPGTNVFHGFYNIHAIFPLPKDHIHYWQLKSWEPFVFALAFAMTRSQNLYVSRWSHPQIFCAQCPVSICAQCVPSPPWHRTPGITVDMVDDRTKFFLLSALRTNVFYCLQLCIANSLKWTQSKDLPSMASSENTVGLTVADSGPPQ